MAVTIRAPQSADFESLAAIYNHAVVNTAVTFDTEPRHPSYYERFPSDGYRLIVAELEGKVVGYAGTYPFSDRKAYSQCGNLMLYIDPHYQRRGIGSALLTAFHRDFVHGLFTIVSLMNKENTHMHRMLERLGYEYKGEMTDVGFKFGKRHSIVIYQRHVDGIVQAAID